MIILELSKKKNPPEETIKRLTPILNCYQKYFFTGEHDETINDMKFIIAFAHQKIKNFEIAFEMFSEVLSYEKSRISSKSSVNNIHNVLKAFANIFSEQQKDDLEVKMYYECFKSAKGSDDKALYARNIGCLLFNRMQLDKAEKYLKYAFDNIKDFKVEGNLYNYLVCRHLYCLCLIRRNDRKNAYENLKKNIQIVINQNIHLSSENVRKEVGDFVRSYAKENNLNQEVDLKMLQFYNSNDHDQKKETI